MEIDKAFQIPTKRRDFLKLGGLLAARAVMGAPLGTDSLPLVRLAGQELNRGFDAFNLVKAPNEHIQAMLGVIGNKFYRSYFDRYGMYTQFNVEAELPPHTRILSIATAGEQGSTRVLGGNYQHPSEAKPALFISRDWGEFSEIQIPGLGGHFVRSVLPIPSTDEMLFTTIYDRPDDLGSIGKLLKLHTQTGEVEEVVTNIPETEEAEGYFELWGMNSDSSESSEVIAKYIIKNSLLDPIYSLRLLTVSSNSQVESVSELLRDKFISGVHARFSGQDLDLSYLSSNGELKEIVVGQRRDEQYFERRIRYDGWEDGHEGFNFKAIHDFGDWVILVGDAYNAGVFSISRKSDELMLPPRIYPLPDGINSQSDLGIGSLKGRFGGLASTKKGLTFLQTQMNGEPLPNRIKSQYLTGGLTNQAA